MQVEQRQVGDGLAAQGPGLGQVRRDLAAKETAAAQNGDVHRLLPRVPAAVSRTPDWNLPGDRGGAKRGERSARRSGKALLERAVSSCYIAGMSVSLRR